LRRAYDEKNIVDFDNIVNDKNSHILDDDFMADFIEELRKVISLEKIKSVVIPYERIKTKYLAKILKTEVEKVELYLMQLILDGKIFGFIDDEGGYFENTKHIKSEIDQ